MSSVDFHIVAEISFKSILHIQNNFFIVFKCQAFTEILQGRLWGGKDFIFNVTQGDRSGDPIDYSIALLHPIRLPVYV